MTNDTDLGLSRGKMADSTLGIGRTAGSMEKDCTSRQMGPKGRVSGKMVKMYGGLIRM